MFTHTRPERLAMHTRGFFGPKPMGRLLAIDPETWSPKTRTPNSDTLSRVTANGFPSRRHTPDSGWVTLATAGLLARGSRRLPGLPGYPVAYFGRALAAHSCGGSRGFDRFA